MAKKSMLEREKKRNDLIKKYSEKRNILLKELKKEKLLGDQTIILSHKLQKLPRNSSKTRARNRCWKTGRPRGYFRYFGLCRNILRQFAHQCLLPGITKASW